MNTAKLRYEYDCAPKLPLAYPTHAGSAPLAYRVECELDIGAVDDHGVLLQVWALEAPIRATPLPMKREGS